MHERYLFPVFALLAFAWYARFTIWIYLGLAVTFLAQLAYVLSVLNAGNFIPDGHWSIYVLVPANIVLLGLSLRHFCRMQRPRMSQAMAEPLSHPPPAPDDGEEQRGSKNDS